MFGSGSGGIGGREGLGGGGCAIVGIRRSEDAEVLNDEDQQCNEKGRCLDPRKVERSMVEDNFVEDGGTVARRKDNGEIPNSACR